MNHSALRTFCTLILLSSLSLFLGCGDGLKEVTGTVNLDGQPLPSGNIRFFALDGTTGPSNGEKIENGAYTLPKKKGLVPGRYRVEIRAYRPSQDNISDPGEDPVYPPEQYLPARYNEDSELEVEFNGDALPTFDIKLDSPQ